MTTEQQEGNRMISEYRNNGWHEDYFVQNYHESFDSLSPVAKRVKEELIGVFINPSKPAEIGVFINPSKPAEIRAKAHVLSVELERVGGTFEIEKLFPAVVRAIEFLNSVKK